MYTKQLLNMVIFTFLSPSIALDLLTFSYNVRSWDTKCFNRGLT